MSIITRIGFCPICEKMGRAKINQLFLAFGKTSNDYHVLRAECNSYRSGYVPHIYKAKINGQNVIVEKSCAMYECGVGSKIKYQEGHPYNFYYVKSWERQIWTLETWNALIELKHNEFTRMYEI